MVQKCRVHRFANRIVAAERERDVAHPAAGACTWQVFFDPANRIDEVYSVVVVLFDPGGHGKNVWIKDDVFSRETDIPGEDVVGATANIDSTFKIVRLTFFVKGHDYHSGPVSAHSSRLSAKRLFPFLEADRIHNRFALHAAQAGFNHRPLRRIDHDRDAGDVRLGGDQIQEVGHCPLGIEHAFVHIDVDHLGAALDLFASDLQGAFEVAGQDQTREFLRSGDVGTFADIKEIGLRSDDQRLQSGEL